MSNLLSEYNPVYRNYVFWTGVLILKMLAMSVLTGCKRYFTKVLLNNYSSTKKKVSTKYINFFQTFANPEDVHYHKVKVSFNNENVERIRRAHRNDLESVLPLILIGYFYTQTNPSAALAIPLYAYAAIFRLLHTLVYAVWVLPQPARAIAFVVPLLVTGYMAVVTIFHYSQIPY